MNKLAPAASQAGEGEGAQPPRGVIESTITAATPAAEAALAWRRCWFGVSPPQPCIWITTGSDLHALA
jgi:hypothetical protein